MSSIHEIRAHITSQIVTLLESGTQPWRKQWRGSGSALPKNFATGARYNGINILWLWIAQRNGGFPTSEWATFQQVRAQGGNVKKGEKGTPLIFYKSLSVEDEKGNAEGEEEEKRIPMMRYFTVFNRAQCEGLASAPVATVSENDPIEVAESFARNTGAVVQHGGDRAFYMPLHDKIVMPYLTSFTSSAAYYGTLMHELTHWTSHETRCNRSLGKRFGDMDYAAEELIAELGAAFVCGEIGIETDLENHASYLAHWIKLLKGDDRAIFTAAAAAAKAADYLRSLQAKADTNSAACG